MIDTYNTHYQTYYTTAHVQTIMEAAPSTHYVAAVSWVQQLQRKTDQQMQRLRSVLAEITRRRIEKDTTAGAVTQMEEDEKKEVEDRKEGETEEKEAAVVAAM